MILFRCDLSVCIPLVLAAVLPAMAPGDALAVPGTAWTKAVQVTGAADEGLQLSPDEHGRLIEVLASEAEWEAWQSLTDTAARESYLERFWEIRDPTPGTSVNEVRDLFMERAALAARMFGQDDVPGWATARGRALLVYGLPEEQERRATDDEPELRWSWSEAPGSVTIRFEPAPGGGWQLPEAGADLDWEAFAANARETIRLPVARAAYSQPEESASSEDEDAPAADDGVAAEEEAVEAPPLPPETVAWLRLVREGTPRQDLELDGRIYYFPAPDGTFMLVGFDVGREGLTFAPVEIEDEEDGGEGEESRSEEGAEVTEEADGQEDAAEDSEAAIRAVEERADLRAFGGVLAAEGGDARLVHQFNLPFEVTRPRAGADVDGVRESATDAADDGPAAAADAPPGSEAGGTADSGSGGTETDDWRVRSFGVTLTPGLYRFAWGVTDVDSEGVSLVDEMIRVPDFTGDELQVSSVILALPPHRRATETMSVADVYRGLRVGSSLLNADVDRVFGRDERFEVVFIVSGWQDDEATPGRPRLEVGYRILVIEPDGSRASIARLPVQELGFHAVGQEIPLGQIQQIEPGGRYELEITVRDLVADAELVEIVPFSVAPDPEAVEE